MKMKKLITAAMLILSVAASAHAIPAFKSGTYPLVDGVYNSTAVIVTNRLPVFSWEYTGTVATFTVTVADDSGATIWDYTSTTSSLNTINFITRVAYNADSKATANLAAGKTYTWTAAMAFVSSTSVTSQFTTVSSVATLPEASLNLEIDWNNPFDPSKNQLTKFVFAAKDRDRRVQMRVFTLSGVLVQQWSEQTVLKDAWYTIDWNGKNLDGEVVARGIYLVSLIDVGEGKGITKKVAVVKEK